MLISAPIKIYDNSINFEERNAHARSPRLTGRINGGSLVANDNQSKNALMIPTKIGYKLVSAPVEGHLQQRSAGAATSNGQEHKAACAVLPKDIEAGVSERTPLRQSAHDRASGYT